METGPYQFGLRQLLIAFALFAIGLHGLITVLTKERNGLLLMAILSIGSGSLVGASIGLLVRHFRRGLIIGFLVATTSFLYWLASVIFIRH